MLDNLSVAILSLVNELGSRFELSPCDFVATLDTKPDGSLLLRFEAPPERSDQQARFTKMLQSLRISEAQPSIEGDEHYVFRVVNDAVARYRAGPRGR